MPSSSGDAGTQAARQRCTRYGQVTFSEVTEPERLLALTRRALADASQPKVSYEVDVAALDGDDADLGDTVAVIDTSRDPEWRLTARVVRRVRTFDEQVVARVTDLPRFRLHPTPPSGGDRPSGRLARSNSSGTEVSQRRVGPLPCCRSTRCTRRSRAPPALGSRRCARARTRP